MGRGGGVKLGKRAGKRHAEEMPVQPIERQGLGREVEASRHVEALIAIEA